MLKGKVGGIGGGGAGGGGGGGAGGGPFDDEEAPLDFAEILRSDAVQVKGAHLVRNKEQVYTGSVRARTLVA